MSTTIWKWIFEMSTNEVLLQISNKHKIKVPGFRKLKLDKTFNILRPQLIRSMLENKKIVLIKSDLNKMSENDERLLQFRSKSIDQLFILMDKENNTCDILVSLLSSGNVEHRNLGETVYSRLLETGKIEEYEKKMVNIKKEGEEALITSDNVISKEKEYIDLKKKIQKSEIKNNELNLLLSHQKETFQKQISSLKENEIRLRNENKQLIEKLASIEMDNQKMKSILINEESVIKERDLLLQDKTEEIQSLLFRLTELQIEIETETKREEENVIEYSENIQDIEALVNVMIVGNPINVSYGESIHVVKIIESHEIGKLIGENEFIYADEVWMLTYDISLSEKRKLLNHIPKSKVLEFTNILELQFYIDKKKLKCGGIVS